MLKILATAVCNRCKVSMPISVVFSVVSCKSGHNGPTVPVFRPICKSQNASNIARCDVCSGQASCGPHSRFWDLFLSHLSPSISVILCEYVDSYRQNPSQWATLSGVAKIARKYTFILFLH